MLQKDHGPYCPFNVRLIGYFLMMGAIYNLTDVPAIVPTFIGLLLTILGLAAVASRAGIQINLETRQYRDYFDLFKTKLGSWHSLPEIEYISVFGATVSQNISSRVSGTTLVDKSIEVNIVGTNREKIFVQDYDSEADALKLAKQLAESLGAKIYLASEQQYYDHNLILVNA
jgi:hypothetical protein